MAGYRSPDTQGVPEETLDALDRVYYKRMTSDEGYEYMAREKVPIVTPLSTLSRMAKEAEKESGTKVMVTEPRGSEVWRKYPTAEGVVHEETSTVCLHPSLRYRNEKYIRDVIEHGLNEIRASRGEKRVRTPHVIYVKSWRDIPAENVDSTVKAMLVGNAIYITERATKESLEHELHHFRKRHAATPRTPRGYIDKERDAVFRTYEVMRRPVGIRQVMYALLADLKNEYGVPYDRGMDIVRASFSKLDIPDRWRNDIEGIHREAQEWGKTLSEAVDEGKEVSSRPVETIVRQHPRRKPKGGSTVVQRHRRRTPKRGRRRARLG